jgi:hypothetical protein
VKRLDDVTEFLSEKIQDRKQYIKEIIEGLRSQVKELDNQFNSLNNSFTMAVAQYDSGSPQYFLKNPTYMCFDDDPMNAGTDIAPGSEVQTYNLKENLTSTAKPAKDYIIIPGVQWVFYTKSSGKYYGWEKEVPSNAVYEDSHCLKARSDELIEWMNLEIFPNFKGLKNDGTYAACISTKRGIEDIDEKMKGILKELKSVFQYDFATQYDKVYKSIDAYIASDSNPVENRLVQLQEFFNAKLDESFIDKDAKLKSY